jgi:hypothetical protein
MSLATIAGFLVAYPMSHWLVTRGIKHGMMTQPLRTMTPSPAAAHGRTATPAGMAHEPGMPHAPGARASVASGSAA